MSNIFSHSLFLTISAKAILINDLILMNPVCIQTDIKIFMVFDSLTQSNPSPVLNGKYQYRRSVTLFEPTFYLTFAIRMI